MTIQIGKIHFSQEKITELEARRLERNHASLFQFLLFQENDSHKFWQIAVNQNLQTVTFGRYGTYGQTQEKTYQDEESAVAEANKLIDAKIKEGYQPYPYLKHLLLTAVLNNNIPDIEQAVYEGEDINQTYDGFNLLHLAAGYNTHTTVETAAFLIDLGCDLNFKDQSDHYRKNTIPIESAAFYDKWGLVELFLERGTDISINDAGSSILFSLSPLELNKHIPPNTEKILTLLKKQNQNFNANHRALLYAVPFKNYLTLLIKYGTDLTAKNEQGWTLLHELVKMDSKKVKDFQVILELLLKQGCDPNAVTTDTVQSVRQDYKTSNKQTYPPGTRPLEIASSDAKTLLSKYGATEPLAFSESDLAFLTAVKANEFNKVRSMLAGEIRKEVSDEEKNTALHYAVLNGSLEMLRLLLDSGFPLNEHNLKGYTPLLLALTEYKKVHEEMAALLIAAGADVDKQKSGNDYASLHYLAKNYFSRELIEAAIRKTKNIDTRSSWGYTPLHVAAVHNNRMAVGLFLDHGADINARSESEATPLFLAASGDNLGNTIDLKERGLGDDAAARELYHRGADLSAVTEYGANILTAAAEGGLFWLAEKCLAAGIDIKKDPESEYTKNAVQEAVENRHHLLALLLIRKGSNISRLYICASLLHWAVEQRNTQLVEELMDYGIDPSVKNVKKKTAAKLAEEFGETGIVEIIKKRKKQA